MFSSWDGEDNKKLWQGHDAGRKFYYLTPNIPSSEFYSYVAEGRPVPPQFVRPESRDLYRDSIG